MTPTASARGYAFVLDGSPVATYQAWQLADSLVRHGGAAGDVHVYAGADVDPALLATFDARGYAVHRAAADADPHTLANASGCAVLPVGAIATGNLHAAGDAALTFYDVGALNVRGQLDGARVTTPVDPAALARANDAINRNFESRIFWDFRYAQFPERGSGVGSRGDLLLAKQQFLRDNRIETAQSILDVGCGDLEVLKIFPLHGYVGLDRSPSALERARAVRPDLDFRVGLDATVAPADLVLCFEVLIHQPDAADYRGIIDFLAAKTRRTLLVSGYERADEASAANGMLAFHEPLSASLARTGAFARIEPVRSIADRLTVFRCEV